MTDSYSFRHTMEGVWRKLERLRACCDVQVSSFLDQAGLLCWSVSVVHRGHPEHTINTLHRDIEAAVTRAVAQAEEAGWLAPA